MYRWSGAFRSKLGAVPHETGLFHSKLQPVRFNLVLCVPNQLAFRMNTVHSVSCSSRSSQSGLVRSGLVRSGAVQLSLVRSGPFWSK